MRAIHVIRKPISAGSVAGSLIEFGTGALNVDATRIMYASNDSMDGNTVNKGRKDGRIYGGNALFDSVTRVFGDGVKAHAGGRWPANAILQHQPGCEQVGVQTMQAPVINRWEDGAKPFGGGAGHPYTSESQGEEQVEIWQCVAGCGVEDANAQGHVVGSHPAGKARGGSGQKSGQNVSMFAGDHEGNGMRYGDEGGVSRFFKVLK